MNTLKLVAIFLASITCGPALAVTVDILDCGGVALDLCDEDECVVEVDAEGFIAIIKVSAFDDIYEVTLKGGVTILEFNDPDDQDTVINWEYSCSGHEEENVDWLRPKVMCAPQRRQLTYAIDIGGMQLNDDIRVELEACAKEDGTEVCDTFDRLVIKP
jgi:hypothetical protein